MTISQQAEKIKTLPEVDSTEALRRIIAKQEQREVGYDEAREIGASLIEFYQVLAEEACDDSES